MSMLKAVDPESRKEPNVTKTRRKQFKEKEAHYLIEFCRAAFLKVYSMEH